MPSVRLSLKWWAHAIRLSGGAISPSKSFWWLIDFKWDKSKGWWSFRRRRDFDDAELLGSVGNFDLVLADLDGSDVALRWLEPDESERTLGVMMSPLHNPKAQYEVLAQKALDWATTVRAGRLLTHDALPLLRSTILKTLEYPMALTTISKAKWSEIMKPVLWTILPKAGICRRFPREVVYALIHYQGVGVPHPAALQLYKHLDMLLRHPANLTKTGAFLLAVLEAHQLETGTSYGLFQQVFSNTGILASETWAKRVWCNFERFKIYVELALPPLALLREGDCLLMESIIDHLPDQETLKWLNWCRMYLHVVTLSDIVTADGKSITQQAWSGQRDDARPDRYHWPRVNARPPSGGMYGASGLRRCFWAPHLASPCHLPSVDG